MQRTMLFNQRQAINPDDLPLRENLLQSFSCHLIFRRIIERKQNRTVHNQEIRIRSRQPLSLPLDRIRHRERNQPVRLAVHLPKGLQLLLHRLQFFKMFIRFIRTLHIRNRIHPTETRQRIDMAIGIVACQNKIRCTPNTSFK